MCGPSGSGKSTTLAALVNLFNETRHDHVITMEDPVEFVHPFKNCLVNQREVGARHAVVRRAPCAPRCARTPTSSSSASCATTRASRSRSPPRRPATSCSARSTRPRRRRRSTASWPPSPPTSRVRCARRCRNRSSTSSRQRLLPSKEPRKQVAAFEVLRNTLPIANMIRDEKTFQIPSAMQIGKSQGMQTFDDAARGAARAGRITGETAYRRPSRRRTSRPSCSGGSGGRTLRPARASQQPAAVREAVDRARLASSAKIDRFLRLMTSRGASDLHLTVGRPPMLRVTGSMEPIRYRTLLRARLRRADPADRARADVGGVHRHRRRRPRLRDRGRRALPRQPLPPAARLGGGLPRHPLEDHDARAARAARPDPPAGQHARAAWCWSPGRPARASPRRWPP